MTKDTVSIEADGLHGFLIVPSSRPRSLVVCIHGGGCNGRYFDLPGFSFAGAAVKGGHAVLAVDRPGHGASPAIAGAAPVRRAADMLPPLIAKALLELGDCGLPVALFGHSIGGALAMHCASQSADMPACLVTSGIGVQPTHAALAWHRRLGQGGVVELPHDFFFGPRGSFDWRAPYTVRKAAELWRKADVDEVMLDWPLEFGLIASGISVPTLCILSEHERIWETDDAVLDVIRNGFVNAPVKVQIAAGGGHLYEVHCEWSSHAKLIIGFIEEHIK